VAADALVLISPPLKSASTVVLPPEVSTLIVGGEADEWVPVEGLRALEGSARVVIVAGAEHSWWPGIERLIEATVSFVREPGQRASSSP